jgi:hypothetical protein
MPKLRQTHQFHLPPEHVEGTSHDELAAEALEHAKGGHTIAVSLPSVTEPVIVHPDEPHEEVVQRFAAAAGSHAQPPRSSRKGSIPDAG